MVHTLSRFARTFALAGLVGCNGSSLPVEAAAMDGGGTNACALLDHTTSTGTGLASCNVVDRDTTACAADRAAQGLTGFWQRFSCRVTLSKVTVNGQPFVRLVSDDRPDT